MFGGVAVMVVATLAGAALWSGGEAGVSAWRVVRDLPAGAQVSPADLEAVTVVVPEGTSFAPADAVPVGRLARPVASGELLPADAVVAQTPRDVRLVTVPVEPLHAPVDLAPGSVVDVWSTPQADLGGAAVPSLVLPGASVVTAAADPDGVTGAIAVVLEVHADDAAMVVAAARGGVIDLVAVPAVP